MASARGIKLRAGHLTSAERKSALASKSHAATFFCLENEDFWLDRKPPLTDSSQLCP